ADEFRMIVIGQDHGKHKRHGAAASHPVFTGVGGMQGQSLGHRRGAPFAAKSGIVIESLSGQGMILNRKLARLYRRLLTESAGGGRIARRMQNRKVILRARVRYRCVTGASWPG